MSLALSASGPFEPYASKKKSEPRPRWLNLPDTQVDGGSVTKGENLLYNKLQKHAELQKYDGDQPYNRLHGDATPQQPDHYNLRFKPLSYNKTTLLQKPHPRPFHLGAAPGKRESKQDENIYHRVWMTDMGNQGKWNKERKEAYYREKDRKLFALKPHDEKFATWSNRKVWTHLNDGGAKPGGQEKLEFVPARQTGLHMKYGLYKGKFENVKHAQLIVNTGTTTDDGDRDDLALDEREMFDTNMKDDMINRNRLELQWATETRHDIYRPKHTLSCPQMGYYFTHRC